MIKKLIVLIIIGLAVFIGYNSVVIVDADKVAVVRDGKSGLMVQTLRPGYNFVRYGITHWKMTVDYFPRSAGDYYEICIPLPALEPLESRYYSVLIPLNISYTVDSRQFHVSSIPASGEGSLFSADIRKTVTDAFKKEMAPYIGNDYKRKELEQKAPAILQSVRAQLERVAVSFGITVTGWELVGSPSLPDAQAYLQGVQFMNELRIAENQAKKELLLLHSKLKKDELETRQYLNKLREVAQLLKGNPDLLRYVYVDKLSKNVKVIISSDRSGMPVFSGVEKNEVTPVPKGEIDNLR